MADDFTREQVARLFPSWELSTGTDLRMHARMREYPDVTATGEDWTDLIDEIRRADALHAGVRFVADNRMST